MALVRGQMFPLLPPLVLEPQVRQICIAGPCAGCWVRREAIVTLAGSASHPSSMPLLRLDSFCPGRLFLGRPGSKTERQQWPAPPALRRGHQDLAEKDTRRQGQSWKRPRGGEFPFPPARLRAHPHPLGTHYRESRNGTADYGR